MPYNEGYGISLWRKAADDVIVEAEDGEAAIGSMLTVAGVALSPRTKRLRIQNIGPYDATYRQTSSGVADTLTLANGIFLTFDVRDNFSDLVFASTDVGGLSTFLAVAQDM